MPMNHAGPLSGLTVVESGTMLSGPTVGRFLADFGADVIKIEHPEFGDHVRNFGAQKDGIGMWHKYLSRNKRSVTLDISTEQGREIFLDLIEECDVLTENFRPGTLEKWDLGWDTVSERNQGLVLLRMSGYGQTGPYADKPGFGTLAEAMSGFAYINGFEDREPLLPPTGLADNIAALYGTFAVMFAIYHRDVHDGDGQVIDVSLIEPIFNLIGPFPLTYDQLGEIAERSGNQSTESAPRNVYRTKDDRFVALAASAQPLAMRTFEAIGRPDLKEDERFKDNERRLEHADELDAIIQTWMADHSREEVLDIFDDHDATIAPVYNVEDIVHDEHYQARNAAVSIDDDELGEALVQNTIPKFSETPGSIDHLGPSLGEHTEEVLKGTLGYTDDDLERLADDGVI